MRILLKKTKYHRFVWTFPYSTTYLNVARGLKDLHGWKKFSFTNETSVTGWAFSDAEILNKLVDTFPTIDIAPEVEIELGKEALYVQQRQQVVKVTKNVRNKVDTSFKVNNIKGELYPYQKVGVEFIEASHGRAIIADQPGLGKTLQALGYAMHKKFERTLVVCPASVKYSWRKEVEKWTKATSFVIDGSTVIRDIPPDAQFWIINYDLLKKHLQELCKVRFDFIVGDEAHMLKNVQAQRTKAFRTIAHNIPNVVLMTGTPLLSRPIELFSLLNIIDARAWNNYYEYARRYCNGHQSQFGFDASGASHMEELNEKIQSYFIRRRKEEVLKQLPPKNHIKLPVALDKDSQREYEEVEDNYAGYFIKESKGGGLGAGSAGLVKLNALRQITSKGKIHAAMDIIDSCIANNEKVLVFSSFVAPLKELHEAYGDVAVIITGEVAEKDRNAAIEAFQGDPNTKVFLGGYKSGGVGITLTEAENVIFLDYSWNPADHQQAEDRAHRPGAKAKTLNIYQIYALNTLDEKLEEVLTKKRKIFDKIIDGTDTVRSKKTPEAESMEEVVKYIVDRKNKRDEKKVTKEDIWV
jgi:SWI/SNF-related matrix-associated actin-dependent regulator 1 of chromatin subfamily A